MQQPATTPERDIRPGRTFRVALAAALGAGVALSFAPLGHALWQLGGLILFFGLLWRAAEHGAGARDGALLGFAFGMGCFTVGVSWLYISMHDYGGMPAPLAAGALLLFCAYLALFHAVVCSIALAVWRSDRPWAAVAGSAGLWTLGELLRGWLFTGFPWLSIGYGQVDGVFASLAPWLGVHGVSLFAVLCASGVGLVLARLPRPDRKGLASGLACGAIAFGLAIGASGWEPPESDSGSLRVRLVQGNVPQELKFDPQRSRAAMIDYTLAVDASKSDLTVFPETAWTIPWSQTPGEIAQSLLERIAATGGLVAIGKPIVDRSDHREQNRWSITNSVAVIAPSEGTAAARSPGVEVARYDKRHLVPFGEFVPWGFRWFVELMNIPLGEFQRGAPDQPLLAVRQERVAFNICYEDLFGHELAQQVRQGATVLINATNIGWFGRSHALGQHLQIARMRSIELSRPMLRATNTGVTAAIDHRGRVTARLPDHQRGALIATVVGQKTLTPFARLGQWPVTGLAALLAAIGWFAGTRRGERGRNR
jgi:apolipoprotein N-acyltransferase